MTDRNEPLRLMDEIERTSVDDGVNLLIGANDLQALRTALEAQLCRFNEETSELHRNFSAETSALRDELAQAKRSAAALKAEVLGDALEVIGHDDRGADAILAIERLIDHLEREAKEQGDE